MHTHFGPRRRLIAFAWMVVPIIVSFGCHFERTPTKEEVLEQNFGVLAAQARSPAEDVALEVVDRVPSLLQTLKPGMTPPQVLRALHLPDNLRWVTGSGPNNNYGLDFFLQNNRRMILRFNMLRRPPAFVEAKLFGEGWADLQR